MGSATAGKNRQEVRQDRGDCSMTAYGAQTNCGRSQRPLEKIQFFWKVDFSNMLLSDRRTRIIQTPYVPQIYRQSIGGKEALYENVVGHYCTQWYYVVIHIRHGDWFARYPRRSKEWRYSIPTPHDGTPPFLCNSSGWVECHWVGNLT